MNAMVDSITDAVETPSPAATTPEAFAASCYRAPSVVPSGTSPTTASLLAASMAFTQKGAVAVVHHHTQSQ